MAENFIKGGAVGKFWTAAPGKDPKRSFRFRIEIGTSGPLWYAKKADKPSLSFGEATHNYLNHTYYWPAKAEWNEVSITFVDPVEPNLAGDLVTALKEVGYIIPAGTGEGQFRTPSKKASTAAWGGGTGEAADDVRIIQIDEEGNPLETWTLKHAWIKEVTFGDLDYGSDDLTEVVVKFRYDWAQFDSPAMESGAQAVSGFAVG